MFSLSLRRAFVCTTSSARFLSTHKLPTRCPSCSQPLLTSLPACTKCSSISSLPSDTPYHDIFSLCDNSNPFVVDESLLKQRFRQLQAVCHPDTWASKGPGKQDTAQHVSSMVNHAYQTLLHPLSRAEYILSINGHPMSETDKLEDMEFLAEIMMSREDIENAETQEDAQQIEEENQEKIDETLSDLERLVEEKDWVKVKDAAIRLKYLDGIRRAAQGKS